MPKVTEYLEMTTATDDDVLYIVNDADGTPGSRHITCGNFRSSVLGAAAAVTTLAESGTVSLGAGTQITLSNFRTSLYAGLAIGLEDGLAQIAIGRVGSLAGADNTGDYQVAIGRLAGYSNTGHMQVAVGRAAGYDNSGDYQTSVGYYAGYQNAGESCTQIGYQAGRANTEDRQTAIGYNAGYNNVGTRQTCVGEDAGLNNVGTNQACVGENAGAYNRGNQQVAMGEEAGQCNLGVDNVALGRHAGRGMPGSYNTAVGNDSYDTWPSDTGNAKTFDDSDVNVGTQRITVTGHSFGADDAYVNLLFTAAGAGVPGMDDGEVCRFLIVDANTLELSHPQNTITGTGVDNGHTLTPGFTYNNSTAVGYQAMPDASNQVAIGNASVTEVVSSGAFVTAAAMGMYFGDPDTNDTWRLIRSGNNLVIQRRESDSYVTKSTISA